MKACPFCGAQIEESARFCLYCMAPLTEKTALPSAGMTRRRAVILVVAVTAVLLLVGVVVLLLGKGGNTPAGDGSAVTATTTTATTTTTAPADTVRYLYRQATAEDDYNPNYYPDEDEIVITGVIGVSESGIYEIPETIDGNTVIAVDTFAFSDENVCENVKAIVIPAMMRTIGENAFLDCVNLSDLYFRCDAVYMHSQYRIGRITIHAAYDCSDRNFRYYRNYPLYYDAVLFEEWDGGEL